MRINIRKLINLFEVLVNFFEVLVNFFEVLVNFFTKEKERHNRALREIKTLSSDIEEFFANFGIRERKTDLRLISENMSQARLTLIAIEYHTRTRIKLAKDIKGKDVILSLQEVHSDLEEVKRVILNPILSKTVLDKSLVTLHKSFKNFHEAIADIEYI